MATNDGNREPNDSGQMTYFFLPPAYFDALDTMAAREDMSRSALIVELMERHLTRNRKFDAEEPEDKTVYTRIPVENLERLSELASFDRKKRTDYMRGVIINEIRHAIPPREKKQLPARAINR